MYFGGHRCLRTRVSESLGGLSLFKTRVSTLPPPTDYSDQRDPRRSRSSREVESVGPASRYGTLEGGGSVSAPACVCLRVSTCGCSGDGRWEG